ncbi:MAG TPA: ankyrin repeat domain-containing protein [Candidatus Babeliales bacterium]|nr:ankyrin repeat domain-containing protein [Candidatus Babeliales bacterium]
MMIARKLLLVVLFGLISCQTIAMKRHARAEAAFNRAPKRQKISLNESLHQILETKDFYILWTYVTTGADVNEKDGKGYPFALNVLSSELTEQEKDECFKILVAHGADLNAQAPVHGTALLHYVVSSKDVSRTRELLRCGVHVDAQDFELWTPLHYACGIMSPSEKRMEIAEMLVDGGADVNAQNIDGNTPLHYAESDKKLSRFLVLRGADVTITNDEGKTAYDCLKRRDKKDSALKDNDSVRAKIIMPVLLDTIGNPFTFWQNREYSGREMNSRLLTLH